MDSLIEGLKAVCHKCHAMLHNQGASSTKGRCSGIETPTYQPNSNLADIVLCPFFREIDHEVGSTEFCTKKFRDSTCAGVKNQCSYPEVLNGKHN